jgi:hypothetical protein
VIAYDGPQDIVLVILSSHATEIIFPVTTANLFLRTRIYSLINTVELQVGQIRLALKIEAPEVRSRRGWM